MNVLYHQFNVSQVLGRYIRNVMLVLLYINKLNTQYCEKNKHDVLSLSPPPSPNCRRYPSSSKKPFERGKSIQEMIVNQPPSPSPGGYERGMSPDELTSALRKEVGTRYLHHRGSVRANFTSPGGLAFLTRLAQWLNKMGKEKRDYSLLCFHKKGRTRRFCKKIMKSK